MRGSHEVAGSWFIYLDLESRFGAGHPLRVICGMTPQIRLPHPATIKIGHPKPD